MEATVVQCPSCSKKMKIPPTHFGKRIKCPGCTDVIQLGPDGRVVLGGPAAPKAAPKAAPPPPATAGPGAAAAGARGKAKGGKAKGKAKGKGKANLTPAGKIAGKGSAHLAEGVKRAGKAGVLKPAKEKRRQRRAVKSEVRSKALNVKRLSAKDRLEAIEGDKSSHAIGVTLGSLFAILVTAVIVWFVIIKPKPQPTDTLPDEPKNMYTASDVELEETGEAVIGQRRVTIYTRSTDRMEFVKIPGGTYPIGIADATGAPQEGPKVEVTVGDYYLARTEITNQEYGRFVKHIDALSHYQQLIAHWIESYKDRSKPEEFVGKVAQLEKLRAKYDPDQYNHPLQPSGHAHDVDGLFDEGRDDNQACWGITWWDAYAYSQWVNGKQEQRGFLPTEAEWEIAARGPDKTLYPWGDARDVDPQEYGKVGLLERKTPANVGIFKDPMNPSVTLYPKSQNGFGLYDMFGNLGEWCYDVFEPRYYQRVGEFGENPVYGYQVPAVEDALNKPGSARSVLRRAVRTLAYNVDSSAKTGLRVTLRNGYTPSEVVGSKTVMPVIGFRCVFYKDRDAPYVSDLKRDAERAAKIAAAEAQGFRAPAGVPAPAPDRLVAR